MIEIGQRVRFHPFDDIQSASKEEKYFKVTGTVTYINKPHGWFSVEWGNPKMKTSFNFADIDEVVTVCG